MKCTRGRLGASFEENNGQRRPGGGAELSGGGRSPGARERGRREKEINEKERAVRFELSTSHANRSDVTKSR
jgi:hypothetical protein